MSNGYRALLWLFSAIVITMFWVLSYHYFPADGLNAFNTHYDANEALVFQSCIVTIGTAVSTLLLMGSDITPEEDHMTPRISMVCLAINCAIILIHLLVLGIFVYLEYTITFKFSILGAAYIVISAIIGGVTMNSSTRYKFYTVLGIGYYLKTLEKSYIQRATTVSRFRNLVNNYKSRVKTLHYAQPNTANSR